MRGGRVILVGLALGVMGIGLGALAPALAYAQPDAARVGTSQPAASEDQVVEYRLSFMSSAGYDSNAGLAARPEQRRGSSGRDESPPVPDGFASLSLAGAAGWGGRHRFWLATAAEMTPYLNHAWRAFESLGLAWGYRTSLWDWALSTHVSRYDEPDSADANWHARLEAFSGLRLNRAWQVGVTARYAWRRYDEGPQLDHHWNADVRVSWRGAVLSHGFEVGIDGRLSNSRRAVRRQLVARYRVRAQWERWLLQMSYDAFFRFFTAEGRDGHEHLIVGRAEYDSQRRWGVFLLGGAGVAVGEEEALIYDRFHAELGVFVRLESSPSWVEARPAYDADRPPRTRHFRFELPEARTVSVIGTFNDWDPERGGLEPAADGWFEGRFEISAGVHRYQLLIDGVPTRPPGEARYLADGFGGEDAVFEQ